MTVLIEARDVRVTFGIRREGDMPWTKARPLHAVAGVDFTLNEGETLGIVGESGSGKSTLARALIQMVPATVPINCCRAASRCCGVSLIYQS